ncbi:MAG: beta-ketoacyl synthase N-terminal-like domain-containing protein [Nostocaceae cyanobacterium]|nr:beta-ketoacyl synthase N-terminal-like domain-containing protein [Nostocaceae cyanobacterium]
MSASWIDTALAQLSEEIDDCEQAVIRFIEEKKMRSEPSLSVHKINRQLQYTPIAIVGMASIFPQARTLRDYWQNIVNKIDCITDIPETHWNVDDYYDPNPRTPKDKTYCKRGGFIPHVDFNPMEFGIPPNILEVTDVSQLLSLVVAKEALEDAGYGEGKEFNREAAGVILGSAALKLGIPLASRLQYPVWKKALLSSGLSESDAEKIIEKIQSAYVKWDENAFPGMLANVISGRIANRFNLGGINCTVDAACASSLAALKMAISELVEHRCDMMLTGGVDTDNSITAYISFSKTPAVSPGDKVQAFDAKSDGMMLGEGIGMMVLKRLDDAVRDNDKIYAVIKGMGTSSDGRYKSIYAPRKEGQVNALHRAYEDAGIAPETVTLIEAHGTGTMAGDPTEFGSLRQFFGQHNPKLQQIALGTVKSQIGHTKAAAGAASLIKTALALHHKILPPTINITQPNPKLNIENSPFYLNTQTRPWIRAEGEAPRRAGVSSFGFGGTNYHVVLEEYQGEHHQPYRLHNTPSEVLLFADTPTQLLEKCQETLSNLQSQEGEQHYLNLLEACKSGEIPQNAARVGFVSDSRTQACKFLQMTVDLLKNKASAPAWEHPQGIYYRAAGMELSGKVVALFSGQGSQYLEMGREIVMNFPEMRRMYGCMDSLLLKDNLKSVSEVVFPPAVFDEAEKKEQIDALQRTQYAQPAIGMLSAGMYNILKQAGFNADFVAGHSFGEVTALWAAGVLSEEDYCFLVKSRGKAMAAPKDPHYDTGAMLAVKSELSKIESILHNFPQVAIANLNSPRQVVLAGPTPEIKKVQRVLEEQGCAAVLLPVASAFHTPLIAFAQKSFAIAIKSVQFQSPKVPVYTNVTGKEYPRETTAIQKLLETHLSNSVLFKQEIENIYGAGGYCFVEFGPRKVLTNLVKDILGDRPHLAVALNPTPQKDSDRCLREGVVQLRVAGMSLQNLDPYQVVPGVKKKDKKGLSFQLNGSNFVSDKTKKAFAEALQNGYQVKVGSVAEVSQEEVINHTDTKNTKKEFSGEQREEGESANLQNGKNGTSKAYKSKLKITDLTHKVTSSSPTPHTPHTLHTSLTPNLSTPLHQTMESQDKFVNYQQVLASLEYVLTQFQENQSQNLEVHGNYLNHQVEYARTFFQLMQQQNVLFAEGKGSEDAAQIMSSLERSMMQFHSQQGDTLRIHEQYLHEQVEYTKNFFQLIQQEYGRLVGAEKTSQPVVSTDVTIPENGVFPTKELPPLLEVEAVKEESPVPPTAKFWEPQPQPVKEESPVPPTANFWETESKPVVKNGTTALMDKVVEVEPEPVVEISAPVVSEPATTPAVAVDLSNLADNLLAITSEKTGYPVEMLELDMDMEADLGIDSIKRVEIMGALQEMYPDLPKPDNVEELGELRTINQTVEYLQSLVAKKSSVEVATPQVETSTVVETVATPEPTPEIQPEVSVSEPVAVNPETESATGVSIDLTNLAENLLAITSEKTGYPVEMLELDMDMEADLGIDSIKRVEIMGALQEMYPDLPKPDNVEELGELRTINQIVEYLQKLAGGEKKKPHHERISHPREVIDNVKRLPAKLEVLPPPDFWEISLPEGHIGLITDDGSLTTSKLAESLRERGWKLVVLNFPSSLVPHQSPLPPGVHRVTLEDLSEEHLQQQLNLITTNYGSIGAFIHLHPVFTGNENPIAFLPAEKAIVKHIFFMAKHLKATLNQAANGRSCFCTVARLDGAFGLQHQGNFGAIGAGLFGLTKTLIWEWSKVFCRAIDISPEINPETSAQHILAELHDPNHYLTEIAYGSQGRVTLKATTNR